MTSIALKLLRLVEYSLYAMASWVEDLADSLDKEWQEQLREALDLSAERMLEYLNREKEQ